MAEIIELPPPDDRPECVFCHRRKATALCDMPVGSMKYIGHIPRSAGAREFAGETGEHTVRCSRPMCGQCATDMGSDIHLCSDCVKRIKVRSTGRKL